MWSFLTFLAVVVILIRFWPVTLLVLGFIIATVSLVIAAFVAVIWSILEWAVNR